VFETVLNQAGEWQELKKLTDSGLPLAVTGLTEAAKAQLAAETCNERCVGALVVCDSDLSAQKLCEDMSFFLGRNCIYYPSKEIEYYRVDAKSNELEAQRLAALRVLAEGEEAAVLVLGIEALLQFAADFRAFKDSIITLEDGTMFSSEELLRRLEALGYVREETVEGRGQFSVRGGIVDVFPPSAENPYRVEFFGDEIDSIRAFDPIMQTSIERISYISIEAARETVATDAEHPCVADYLPQNAFVFLNEPERIHERAEGLLWNIGETVTALLEKGVIEQA